MSDVYFKCECGKSLAVDEKGAGLAVSCPDCGKDNVVPVPDISWQCDYCDSELSAPKTMVENSVQCLNCRRIIKVPKPGVLDMLPLASEFIVKKSAGIVSSVARAGVKALKSRDKAGKFCSSCGGEVAEGVAFCGKCGAKVSSSPVPESQAGLRPVAMPVLKTRSNQMSGPARKIPAEKFLGIAACIAVTSIVWFNRTEIPGLIDDIKPSVFHFLERARIYKPAQTAEKVAEPVKERDTELLFAGAGGGGDVEELHEPQADTTDSLTTEKNEMEQTVAGVVELDEKRESQLKFLAERSVREEQRLARIEKLKELQKEASAYSSVVPGDFLTLDGQAYRKVQLKRVEPDGISITHSSGAGKVLFRELPRSIAVKYGYEPESAGFYEQSADDTKELTKILLLLQEEEKSEDTASSLIEDMKKYPTAVNMNQADTMLEQLLTR